MSPVGSNPFSILTSLSSQSENDIKLSADSLNSGKQSVKHTPGEKVSESDDTAEELNDDSQTTKQKTSDLDSKTVNNKVTESDKHKDQSETEQENIKPAETESTQSKEDKDSGEGEKKKIKPKREDYEKHSITSKGDYKIRKKLDAGDKLLLQVSLKIWFPTFYFYVYSTKNKKPYTLLLGSTNSTDLEIIIKLCLYQFIVSLIVTQAYMLILKSSSQLLELTST